MMNTDMAIIRDLDGGHLFGPDAEADCTIKDEWTSVDRCPVAATLEKAGLYRDNNALWLSDFKKVMIIMLEKGL